MRRLVSESVSSNVGVYVRGSVDAKTDVQIAELKRWVDNRNIQAAWFIDRNAHCDLEQPQLLRLRRAIRGREIDTVVVWQLERISSNLRELVTLLANWCGRGVHVIAVNENVDISGLVARRLASVLIRLIRIDQDPCVGRQGSGIKRRKKRGQSSGRKRGSTKANPEQAAALRRKGMTDSRIAERLGVSRRTVQRYLRATEISASANNLSHALSLDNLPMNGRHRLLHLGH